ncbi:MAG: transporter, partial [Acidobacteria bacterium]|nr:transporter [Acidobacteriota bacterium]
MVVRILLGTMVAAAVFAGGAHTAWAQGPSPEGGATLFPGGGVVSYNSVFTTRSPRGSGPLPPSARPTFAHRGQFTFAWGMRRDLQLSILAPVVTTERKLPPSSLDRFVGGTGFGDLTVMLKYRVLRLDSPRGTTQLSLAAGPKLPTGRTNLRDSAGNQLPVGLQPGSGSTDA